MNTQDAKRVLETALICAQQPLTLREMRSLFADAVGPDTLRSVLDELSRDWEGRGVELVAVASGWRFQSRPEMREYLDRMHPEKPQRYSRAVMETLAIIAYRQPVTRGDIEDIRGVVVSTQIVKQLEDRAWIEVIGHREAPGRPALYATTQQFLDDLGLNSLEQLPELEAGQAPSAAVAEAAGLQGLLLEAEAETEAPAQLPVDGQSSSSGEVPSEAAAPQALESEAAPDANLATAEPMPLVDASVQPPAETAKISSIHSAPIGNDIGASIPAEPDSQTDAAEPVQPDA
ncbi:SMC-Scp complex subunit ScpB [Kinneretia aquatilis]|uniref:SMC-Scp complex subunit ScpB n=1 Tax=Kinneretia aquatilis TaxID=2070761 RepID=UPI0014951030|nr:SMC-Scp complex subunit ScpB [Paucibacter aquatile]WIV96456.1 SMC-Scp complex subunit ScpB [Paucibacter aquatile]